MASDIKKMSEVFTSIGLEHTMNGDSNPNTLIYETLDIELDNGTTLQFYFDTERNGGKLQGNSQTF
jgi:hypothetical protein